MESLLGSGGLRLTDLEEATSKALDDFARFVLTAGDAPSANWTVPILELCKAVESELAAIFSRLETAQLAQLADRSIGEIGKSLERLSKDHMIRSLLEKRGVKPGQLLNTVPKQLSALARLRRETGAAHGGLQVREAAKKDSDRAIQLVICGSLPLLVEIKITIGAE